MYWHKSIVFFILYSCAFYFGGTPASTPGRPLLAFARLHAKAFGLIIRIGHKQKQPIGIGGKLKRFAVCLWSNDNLAQTVKRQVAPFLGYALDDPRPAAPAQGQGRAADGTEASTGNLIYSSSITAQTFQLLANVLTNVSRLDSRGPGLAESPSRAPLVCSRVSQPLFAKRPHISNTCQVFACPRSAVARLP